LKVLITASLQAGSETSFSICYRLFVDESKRPMMAFKTTRLLLLLVIRALTPRAGIFSDYLYP
jgi:hypothetical protein